MAAEQVIQLSAINVVLHPHPEGIYERFIRAAYRKRRTAHVYGDRSGVFSQMHPVSKDGQTIAYEGVISTFTKLDPHLPWFNSSTSKEASEDELEELNVPDYLQPNHRKCEFYFDLKSHTFVFESLTRKGGISPNQMEAFLGAIFSQPSLTNEFGLARLTVIPDTRTVDEVVEWNRIRTLLIRAHRPNPDYDEDDLREFEQSLNEQNAEQLEMKLTAQPNHYLEPSARVQIIAAIAADNGYVEAQGENELGQREIRSTRSKKPMIEVEYFDPDGETAWDAFRRVAQSLVAEVKRRRRRAERNEAR